MGATHDLAEFATSVRFQDLPADVVHEAKRDVINVLGVALHSARDPSLQHLLRLFEAEGAASRARVWGTGVRTSLQNAALANGYTAHLEDYDDTHFPTVLHPSAPTVPAAFALAEAENCSGRDFLAAVALGIEAACRVSLAVHPWHYDEGWHITGTMGVFGSAVASGRLAGLGVERLVAALGIAGTQAAGVREVFGSMSKPLHAGRAAQAGLVATLLARDGFTSTDRILEGRRGVAAVMSAQSDLSRLTDGLGRRWEIKNNGLKPYACGVVNHPLIDACIAFRERGADPEQIESVDADVHPLVLELVDLPEPKVGLEGKFSVQHCIAAGLIEGAAYPEQFSDAKVNDPRLVALRRKVRLVEDRSLEEDEARVTLRFKDGSVWDEHVRHAAGAPQNPLSDARLEEKFLTLASLTLGEAKARSLLQALWLLEDVPSLTQLQLEP